MPCRVLWDAFLYYMERYSKILEKEKREIVLLRGRGCVYGKCPFCDYHLDKCADDNANYLLNSDVLSQVTGEFDNLEVINSGSVFELDSRTLKLIKAVCRDRNISTIHFESHYLYKEKIPALRRDFSEFNVKMKLGLETFDWAFREKVLKKGIPDRRPEIISRCFDEANFLFGISGQTLASMEQDIILGLTYFERICLNIMCENSTSVRPDEEVISVFREKIYPKYAENNRVDILIENTDFGVG